LLAACSIFQACSFPPSPIPTRLQSYDISLSSNKEFQLSDFSNFFLFLEGREGNVRNVAKDYYQAFFWVLIDLIVELLSLIIKPFDNQTES
jgi:hypothetical protein